MSSQVGILASVPVVGRFVTLGLVPGAAPTLEGLSQLAVSDELVVGVGKPLLKALGRTLTGLSSFPALSGPAVAVPSTQGALWLYFRGQDPGELLLRARKVVLGLGPDFRVDEDVATFRYAGGRDLSGYEDGTENPQGARAAEVALCGAGLEGGSFVAAQRWVHELGRLDGMPLEARNHVFGRDIASNEELADAPESAHVKRAAQESFSPEAFMLRRSMPWGDLGEQGLYFVAFGAALDPYERVLRRMVGLEDGIVDALFRFTRPTSGGYYFCPPTRAGKLDLSVTQQRR